MVLNQEPSAQLGTMNHSLNPRLSTQPGSNLIRLVLSHRLVFFNYDDFGGRWTVDGRRILVFPAFSDSFFASCKAASLSRTFLRASLPREASLASPDAFPGIATWAVLAQSCVPRCFSGQWLFPAISVFSQALSGLPQRSANIGSSDGSSLTVTLNQKVSVVFAFDDE